MNNRDRLAEIRATIGDARFDLVLDGDDARWLVGEVEDLRRAVTAGIDAANDEDREVARLRDLLARLEWAVNCYDDPRCPSCGAYKHGQPPGQHDPGCELAAALAGNDEASRPTP